MLDQAGHLAAGTSTGGITAKKFGRVGDSPIIGAGTYANDATCAVSGTGVGEEFIRHSAAYSITATMEHRGWTLQQAVDHLIDETLDEGIGGVIAVEGEADDREIVLRIVNSVPNGDARSERQGHQMAQDNVALRLRAFFGAGSDLRVSHGEGEYTVELRFPYVKERP